MCGIVGYTGTRQAVPVLLDGLAKLEYRGYDSAGIAVVRQGRIQVSKCKGRIMNLRKKLEGEDFSGCFTGIGHTRWATHGEPSDNNSHPHVSGDGRFCVVHNGIIENERDLRKSLIARGCGFSSETDSEVIAHLLQYNYNGDVVEAISKTIHLLEGSYALGVVCMDYPETVFAARKDSPIIAGKGDGENFLASDIPAILEYTREIYIVEDGEILKMDKKGIMFFNAMGIPLEKSVMQVDWDVVSAEKEGHPHFMLKEIHEEPDAIQKTIRPRIRNGKVVLNDIRLERPDKISIVACGTAYHAGVVGKYVIESLARIPVEVDIASEFRYRDVLTGNNHLTIIISQSGETIDTLFALRKAKSLGSRILSVVNVVGSSIARESDDVFYTWAGPEIAVASTKAYSTQLSAIYLIALSFAEEGVSRKLAAGLLETPDMIRRILERKETIQKAASLLFNSPSIFFLGRGLDYALSMEASLKLKEISYIHSEAYAGGELKHGTIALIEEGTPVICSMTQDNLFDKTMSNIREVKARGARVLTLTLDSLRENAGEFSDLVVTIPDIDRMLAPITAITPMQLFAYYCALAKGCDVDKPRNLAKSVTVE
ncbi:MAG: glutamine--fructose-6-phosphate transaminase (isomerizing) [Clostridia bacterium]